MRNYPSGGRSQKGYDALTEAIPMNGSSGNTFGQHMNICSASGASGFSAKMIRYSATVGLMPAPARAHSGYRIYVGLCLDGALLASRFLSLMLLRGGLG